MTEMARHARGDRNGARPIVGQQRRIIAQPTAAIRNADRRSTKKATIWYSAAATADTISIDVGTEILTLGLDLTVVRKSQRSIAAFHW